MAMYVLVILCCCVMTGHQALGQGAGINGAVMLDLARQFNDSELLVVAKVFQNLERNLSKLMNDTRTHRILSELCVRTECQKWSDWPECPAESGQYGWVTRTRECGQNSTMCYYIYNSPDHVRTEEEQRLCIGGEDSGEDDSEDDSEYDSEYYEYDSEYDSDTDDELDDSGGWLSTNSTVRRRRARNKPAETRGIQVN